MKKLLLTISILALGAGCSAVTTPDYEEYLPEYSTGTVSAFLEYAPDVDVGLELTGSEPAVTFTSSVKEREVVLTVPILQSPSSMTLTCLQLSDPPTTLFEELDQENMASRLKDNECLTVE